MKKLKIHELNAAVEEARAFIKVVNFVREKDWVGYSDSEIKDVRKAAADLIVILKEL